MHIETAYLTTVLVVNYILAAENDPLLSMIAAGTMLTMYMMYRVVEVSTVVVVVE